jgi:single-stranded DNA-specific DHH superfamily exonuclease
LFVRAITSMIEFPQSKRGSSPKIVCVSHIKDVDGCVCAALIRCATKSSFLLTSYGHMKKCLRNIGDNYDCVYVCDLGINMSTMEEFSRIRQFAELTYIDHHHTDEDVLGALKDMGVEILHDLRDCASVLTFDLFKETLPREAGLLAAYAAVSDRLEDGPIAREIIQKYDREFILFETMLLSYALEKAEISLKKRMVNKLSKLEYPHQIEEVPRLALEQADRIVELRNELPSRASKLGSIAYVEAEEGSLGAIANLLLDVCDATIGICHSTNAQKQISDLSIRGRTGVKINLGKTTSQLAKRLGGFGGGHPRASGARIPTLRLMEFINALCNYAKKGNVMPKMKGAEGKTS